MSVLVVLRTLITQRVKRSCAAMSFCLRHPADRASCSAILLPWGRAPRAFRCADSISCTPRHLTWFTLTCSRSLLLQWAKSDLQLTRSTTTESAAAPLMLDRVRSMTLQSGWCLRSGMLGCPVLRVRRIVPSQSFVMRS